MFNKLFLFFFLFFLQTPIKNRFLYKNVFILLYLLQVQQHMMRCDIDEGANDNRSEDEHFQRIMAIQSMEVSVRILLLSYIYGNRSR